MKRLLNSPEAFDQAWSIMKGIVFNGQYFEDIDEMDPMVVEALRMFNQDKEANPLPEPPFQATGRIGKPFKAMRDARLAGIDHQPIFDAMPGFTDSENNMLSTFINWEGGKTSEMPKFRAMARHLGDWERPVEPMTGSGSFVLGMNRGTGLMNDMNPDIVNVHQQAKAGLGDVAIPQSQEGHNAAIDAMNALRERRDVDGEELSQQELTDLARLFVGNNLSSYRTDWRGVDWDGRTEVNEKGKTVPMGGFDGDYAVPYTEGRVPYQSWRDNNEEVERLFQLTEQQQGKTLKDRANAAGLTDAERKKAGNWRAFPHHAGSINLDSYAPRYKGVDIRHGDAFDLHELLRPTDLLYLDPPYIGRDMDYGATSLQRQGRTYDDFQRKILQMGREHEGPSILSNYMYAKDQHQPLEQYIKDVIDSGYTVYPWLRSPKANNFPQVEMFGLKGIEGAIPGLARSTQTKLY